MPIFRVGKPYAQLVLTADQPFPAQPVYDVEWDAVDMQEGEVMFDPAEPTWIELTRPGTWLLDFYGDRSQTDSSQPFGVAVQSEIVGTISQSLVSPSAGILRTSVVAWFHTTVPDRVRARINNSGAAGTLRHDTGAHLVAARIGPEKWT